MHRKPLVRSTLNPEAEEFAKWLFEWKPEWETLAEMVQDENGSTYSLYVELPSPTELNRSNLILCMEDDPTIVFGNFHTHLSLFSDGADGYDIEVFKKHIAEIMSDELVSVFDTTEGGACLVVANYLEAFLLDRLTTKNAADTLEVTSFNGTISGKVGLDDLTNGKLLTTLWKTE